MSRRARNVGSSGHRQHNEPNSASIIYSDVSREMNESSPHNNPEIVSDADFQPSDMIILRALLDGRNNRNMSCEEILDSLDGVNRHTSEQWIRYFLRNIRMVELYSNPVGPSSSIASPQKVRAPASESTSMDRNQPVTQLLHSNRGIHSTANDPDVPGRTGIPNNPGRARRDYHNHEPVSAEVIDLDADNSDSGSCVSRSPTPPKTTLKYKTNRYRYTEEDIEFCIRMGQHMFRQNPNTSLEQIAKKVHDKAPHHPYWSWKTRLTKNPDIVKRMRCGSKKTVLCISKDDSSDDEQQHATTSDVSPKPHSEAVVAVVGDDSIIAGDPIEDAPGDATDDERRLGSRRSVWQPAEERVLARYIALHQQEWSQRLLSQNIKLFHRQYRWSRTETAWAEHYRSNKKAIDDLASRMRLQPRSSTNGKKRATNGKVTAEPPTLPDPSTPQPLQQRIETENKITEHASHQPVEYTGSEVSYSSSNVPRSSFKRKEPDSGFASDPRETDAQDSESFSPSKRTNNGLWPWSLLSRS